MAVAVPAAAGQRFFEAFFALFVFLSSGASSGFLLVISVFSPSITTAISISHIAVSDVSNLIILISQIPQGHPNSQVKSSLYFILPMQSHYPPKIRRRALRLRVRSIKKVKSSSYSPHKYKIAPL